MPLPALAVLIPLAIMEALGTVGAAVNIARGKKGVSKDDPARKWGDFLSRLSLIGTLASTAFPESSETNLHPALAVGGDIAGMLLPGGAAKLIKGAKIAKAGGGVVKSVEEAAKIAKAAETAAQAEKTMEGMSKAAKAAKVLETAGEIEKAEQWASKWRPGWGMYMAQAARGVAPTLLPHAATTPTPQPADIINAVQTAMTPIAITGRPMPSSGPWADLWVNSAISDYIRRYPGWFPEMEGFMGSF